MATLQGNEFDVLNKIARKTKMDCWFHIKQDSHGTDYVYDLEAKRRVCLTNGIIELLEGIDCVENYTNCELSNEENIVLIKLCNRLGVNFNVLKEI